MVCRECDKCYTCQKGYGGKQQGKTDSKYPVINSLTVFPNRLCNLRCSYCFLFDYPRKSGKEIVMNQNTAQRMILWLLTSSNRPRLGIHWFGYEPLMTPDLIKSTTEWGSKVLKGTPKSVHWGMTTNLTLITKEINEFLKKYNYYVLCSIDGTEESHDKYRIYPDGRGSWKDAIRGLKRLLSWNGDRVIRWTINPDTVDQILPGTEYFLNLGIRKIAHEFVYEVEWKKHDLERLEVELTKLIPIMIRHIKREERIDFKPFRDGARSFADRRMQDRCGLARGDIGVNVEGELYRCHRFVDQSDHALGDIWNGLDLKAAETANRWDISKIVAWDGTRETCITCPARMGCNAGCLAVNWDTTKNLYRPPRSHCDIAVVKTRVALKLSREMKRHGLPKKSRSQKGGGRRRR